VQRLQRDVERAVPRAGAEVPRVQLLQHPGDEGALSRGHDGTEVEEVRFSRSPKRPCQSITSDIMVEDAAVARCCSRGSCREGALAAAQQERTRRDTVGTGRLHVQRITACRLPIASLYLLWLTAGASELNYMSLF
jgi:hypothetical protein